VGIGKNNPTTALDVNGTVKASSFSGNGSGLTGLPDGHSLDAADGSPANRVYVDNSGNVGIGTTAPEGDLHVRGAGSPGKVIVTPGVSDSQSQILLAENTSASLGMIIRYDGADNRLKIFRKSGLTIYDPHLVINRDNGYVGIGESSPSQALDVAGNIVASGSVGIGKSVPTVALDVVGNIVATGTITGSSDRNRKENFAAVDPEAALAKVTAMPIQRWNYIDEQVSHIGPMAQDFHGAFQVGMDDKHISMVDADGVALAAIQGLNKKLEHENAELRQRLDRLERLFEQQLSRGEQ
jgi:hypothetical protein